MEQPLGFIDLGYHLMFFALLRLYMALNRHLKHDIISCTHFYYRFINSQSDPSLFIRRTYTSVMILFIYVNDLVVTGSSSLVIINCITTLCSAFVRI